MSAFDLASLSFERGEQTESVSAAEALTGHTVEAVLSEDLQGEAHFDTGTCRRSKVAHRRVCPFRFFPGGRVRSLEAFVTPPCSV